MTNRKADAADCDKSGDEKKSDSRAILLRRLPSRLTGRALDRLIGRLLEFWH
jgi:hypothetical protein